MSQTIDNRIVEMQFENKQFESGVQESLSTLDKLKAALKFDDASKNLEDFSKNINKNIDLSGISKSVDTLNERFSASGIAGMEAIRKLTDFAISAGKTIAQALDAPFQQIRSGGWKRAMNIEDAKFQLKGLGIAWETVSDDINYAVADTAYGLDVAAKACSQLSASGIQAGKDMKAALRGISGVASMGNTEYENITDIFTKAAGNGKVMAQELNRISQYGLNARAEVVKFFNDINSGAEKVEKLEIPEYIQNNVKSLTKGAQMAESELSDFVRKGKLDFETFAYAMDYAFGEHAKAANETFMGSLRNIKAALSKIGAEFATPIIQGAIPVFNQIRIFLNELRKQMGPIFEVFKSITEIISDRLTDKLKQFKFAFLDLSGAAHIGNAIKNVFTSLVKIIYAISNAFHTVFEPVKGFETKVLDVTEAIENFSKHLVISDDAAYVFRNIMVAVFNVLKGIGTIIKNILPIVSKVATMALRVINVIVAIVANLSNLLSKLNLVQIAMEGIRSAGALFAYAVEKIKTAFLNLRGVLNDTSTVTGQVFAKIKEGATMAAYIVAGSLYLAFTKLRDLFSYFDSHDPLGSILEGLNRLRSLPVIDNIVKTVQAAITTIIGFFKKAVETVVIFYTEIKNGATVFEAFGVIAETAIGGIITAFNKLKETVKGWFSVFSDGERVIEQTVESPIYGATGALTGFEHELSATQGEVNKTASSFDTAKGSVAGFVKSVVDKIREIEPSKVILAAYAGVLLMIAYNANFLIKALTGLAKKLSSGFNFFKTSLTNTERFKLGLIEITGAIAVLAAVIVKLSEIPTAKLDHVTNSLLKLVGLIGGLSILSVVLSNLIYKFGGVDKGFVAFSSNMSTMAIGIGILVASLKILESINMTGKELWEKVAVIGALGLALAGFSTIMAKVAPQLTIGSLFMVAFAASTLILVKALDNLSRVPLKGINENWKELGVIIISFAAFAALAGTVGISSTLSLIAFIVGLSTLLDNLSKIKDKLGELGIADLIADFFVQLKESIKNAVIFALAVYNNMTTLEKTMLGIGALLMGGGMAAFFVGIGYASKHIKKAVLSAVVFAASIAGLMYATYKIAEACKTVSGSDVMKAVTMLGIVGVLIGAIIGVSGYFGDYSIDNSKVTGKGKGKSVITNKKSSNTSAYLKQARKLLLDMGILLASVALFCNVIGKLKPEELRQAEGLLLNVSLLISALMIVITVISSNATAAGKANASIVPFIGVIATIGALLGAFVILMNYFKNYNFDKQGVAVLITSLVVLGGIVAAVIIFLKQISKIQRSGKSWASIAAFSAVIAAIGGVVYHLMGVIKNENDLKTAGIIVGGIAAFLVVLSGLIILLEGVSRKLLNTQIRQSAFTKAIIALGVMVGAIVALAGTFLALKNIGAAQMAKQAAVVIGVLVALSTLVMAIQHFSKDSLTSITKTSGPKLKQTMAMIGMFFLAFEALALTFYGMRNVDPNAMASQMLTLVIALTALAALGLAMQHFVKTMNTDWATMGKAAAILAGMTVLFLALAGIFKIIDGFDSSGGELIGKSQTIMLVMLELELLAAAASILGSFGPEIGIGELTLLGMVALFAALTLVFKLIDGLKTEGIMKKSQTIILVMLELELLAAGAGVLGAFAPLVGLGELTLLGMVALFAALTLVFMMIDGLKVEGIMKKSQTIVLVMLELEVLAALCGVLGTFAPLIGLGELTMLGMVALFGALSLVFTVIDGLKTEGIMKKSQTMVLVMLELELLLAALGVISPLATMALAGMPGLLGVVLAMLGVAGAIRMLGDMDLGQIQGTIDIFIDSLTKLLTLAIESSGAGASMLLIAAGIGALALACGAAGVALMVFSAAVATLSEAILKLTATGPSIMSFFASVSSGIAVLASTIMNTITGLSKSVVVSINVLIVGVIAAITNGARLIYAAAKTLGQKMKEGFESILKPKEWGIEFINKLVDGIKSGIGKVAKAAYDVAKAIWTYLHFSEPEPVSPLHGCGNWFGEMMGKLGAGITNNMDSVIGPVKDIGDNIKNTLGGFDFSGIMDISNAMGGKDAFLGDLSDCMSAISLFKKEVASLNSLGHGTRDDFLYSLKQEEKQLIKNKEHWERVAKTEANTFGKATTLTTNTVLANNKALADNRKQQDELANGAEKAASAVDNLAKSFGGAEDAGKKAKGSTKEISDEIATFYDSIEGAISLFQEFNKQTELTSDQLLNNMKSQIDGMSEWADQIQKLAFMGIDQGLLQELAEMGPQGYEYTNAFVHMTADQLAQANNLYHQSLMLPAKVTSQIYGSYTVAGRSAASGFLMGMNKEDVKEAAVGFAHQVVDGMNLALDIQSGKSMVTYEDGVAVVNGVKTGLNAADMKKQLGTAIDLLTKENIKGGFDKGLFNNNQMYNVGANITKGISDGVKDGEAVGDLKGSIIWVCNEAVNAAKSKKATDEHSPSKVFEKIGKFITLGLASGITSETQAATNAITDTSKSIIDTMRDTINRANQALIDDIDEPVITPILDLSEIQNGSRELDNMLSRNSALSAGSSFTNLQNEQWGAQSALLNATMDNTDVVSAISSLGEEITTLKDAMTSIQLVLDTGTMVGAMTPQIDQQLGMRQVYAGRGI